MQFYRPNDTMLRFLYIFGVPQFTKLWQCREQGLPGVGLWMLDLCRLPTQPCNGIQSWMVDSRGPACHFCSSQKAVKN